MLHVRIRAGGRPRGRFLPRQAFKFLCIVAGSRSFVISRRSFFGLDQSSMGSVAIRMIFRPPAAADSDGCRFIEFEYLGRDAGDYMGSITKWRVLGARALQ